MIVAPVTPEENQPERLAYSLRNARLSLWQRVALAGVLLISIFMNFYQLGQNGYANAYYAATIRSMMDSWHTFFFASFDPGGFVTVDKPPLGFWLQVLSAKIFGFSPLSLFLPQALAGVLSVLLLYVLVKRHFGVVPGLLAALALAISPISVVTNRNNTIDSTLVLVMLSGAWMVFKAAETGKLRWLLLCAICVGLGFNIKMLEAYLVVPAFGLLYLLASPRRIWVRLGHLALALLLLVALSLSWVVAVDLTPASQRPYVGSTQDNSELSLAIGYNGVQRLLGAFSRGPGGDNRTQAQPSNNGQNNPFNPNGSVQPPQGFPGGTPPQDFSGSAGGGGNGAGLFNTGSSGLLRLFNEPLGGQIVWLLPLALSGMLALAWQWLPAPTEETQTTTRRGWLMRVWQRRPRLRKDFRQHALLLWGVWLLTMAIFFSVASFFHQYYLSTLAPAICALFGIGVVTMWQDYRRSGWRGWLLPPAILLTALEQIHIILSNPAWGSWLIPAITVTCACGALLLFVARVLPRLRSIRHLFIPALALALVGLLLASAVWSAVPGLENIATNLPAAGPTQDGPGGRGFGGGGLGRSTNNNGNANGLNADRGLISYLEANRGNATYLVAVASANEADGLILATNQPVMALGGFSGSDPILTPGQLATLVKQGTVRFFLLGGFGGGGGGGGQSTLTTWITQNCTTVSSSQLQTTGNSQLYVC